MDAKIKREWIAALRSGKYKQAKGTLRRDGGFCCLGVLCDVMGAQWVDEDAIVNGELQNVYLSNNAADTAELKDGEQEKLWTMNDDGKPFSEIADYIEREL